MAADDTKPEPTLANKITGVCVLVALVGGCNMLAGDSTPSTAVSAAMSDRCRIFGNATEYRQDYLARMLVNCERIELRTHDGSLLRTYGRFDMQRIISGENPALLGY